MGRKLTSNMRSLLLAAVAATTLSACGFMNEGGQGDAPAGPAQTRTYALSGFTGVDLSSSDDVTITRGEAFAVRATGPADVLERLELRVRGNSLEIRRESQMGWSSGRGHAQITITMPELQSVAVAGSGDVRSDSMTGEAASVSIAGSGDVTVSGVNATAMEISIAGSGNFSATGQANSAEVSVAGSGDVDAAGLIARSADVSVAGSGNVAMQVNGAADVSVIGSGDVTLTGGARCTSDKMGSGTISCS